MFAPLSLLCLFLIWACAIAFGIGLAQWAARLRTTAGIQPLSEDFYLSASALFTLSLGEPENFISKWMAVLEGGLGLAFLGLVVGYLPVFYQSFATREQKIVLLDARSGSPPSAGALLRASSSEAQNIAHRLADWEEWASQLLENHLSYPMLAYFRSHHPNQSWLTALVAVVDYAALVTVCSQGELRRQAEFTVAMGRHVLTDMTVQFGLQKRFELHRRKNDKGLTPEDMTSLVEILRDHPLLDAARFTEPALRRQFRMYEAEAAALSDYFLMALPGWMPAKGSLGNWRVPIAEREEVPFAVSDPFAGKDGDVP